VCIIDRYTSSKCQTLACLRVQNGADVLFFSFVLPLLWFHQFSVFFLHFFSFSCYFFFLFVLIDSRYFRDDELFGLTALLQPMKEKRVLAMDVRNREKEEEKKIEKMIHQNVIDIDDDGDDNEKKKEGREEDKEGLDVVEGRSEERQLLGELQQTGCTIVDSDFLGESKRNYKDKIR